jgi:hypothetical protein
MFESSILYSWIDFRILLVNIEKGKGGREGRVILNLETEPILTSLFRPLNDYTNLPASGQGSSVDDPETALRFKRSNVKLHSPLNWVNTN